MGKKYLIDTNAAIDYFGNRLPEKGSAFIDTIVSPAISVITQMEILGWYRISAEEKAKLQEFINDITIIQIDHDIVQKTIELRQAYKIKLPDAIIAATALVNRLILITRNVSDFKNIGGLHVIDPWNL
jgi:hypothetical protein